MIMAEWGIPFDHIEDNWTGAQFMLMWRRLAERKRAESDAVARASQTGSRPYGD